MEREAEREGQYFVVIRNAREIDSYGNIKLENAVQLN